MDVFSEPKRAITEGVVVTPTLIALGNGKRVVLMGDLTNDVQLTSMLAHIPFGHVCLNLVPGAL